MRNSIRQQKISSLALCIALVCRGNTILAQPKTPLTADGTIQEFVQRVENAPPQGPFSSARITKDADGRIVGLTLPEFQLRPGDARTIGQMTTLTRLNLQGSNVSDEDLRLLTSLMNLEELNLWHTPVSDAGISSIAGMRRLKSLSLGSTKVTDAALPEIAKLSELQQLVLARTRVSDAGLKALAGLKRLVGLSLSETQISDTGLKAIEELPSLRGVTLDESRVTSEGVVKFATRDGFGWMTTEAGVVNELSRRVSAGDQAGIQAMLSIGLDLPRAGTFKTRSVTAHPVTVQDTERMRRRLRVEWTWDHENGAEGLFAELAVRQGTARVIEVGVTDR